MDLCSNSCNVALCFFNFTYWSFSHVFLVWIKVWQFHLWLVGLKFWFMMVQLFFLRQTVLFKWLFTTVNFVHLFFFWSLFLPDSSESAWSRLTNSLGFTALSEVLCSYFVKARWVEVYWVLWYKMHSHFCLWMTNMVVHKRGDLKRSDTHYHDASVPGFWDFDSRVLTLLILYWLTPKIWGWSEIHELLLNVNYLDSCLLATM